MQEERHFYGQDEDEIWQQIEAELARMPDLLSYHAIIQQQEKTLALKIDIDPGGGFESGFATTTFSAPIIHHDGFQFALHREHFIDEIGKFFGMQDIEIGASDFDANIVVKATDEMRVRSLFADATRREILLGLGDFYFGMITPRDGNVAGSTTTLELMIEEGITKPSRLRVLYHFFFTTLCSLDVPHQ